MPKCEASVAALGGNWWQLKQSYQIRFKLVQFIGHVQFRQWGQVNHASLRCIRVTASGLTAHERRGVKEKSMPVQIPPIVRQLLM